MRSIPDESTRLAALKRGEVDGIYWISGELAADLANGFRRKLRDWNIRSDGNQLARDPSHALRNAMEELSI